MLENELSQYGACDPVKVEEKERNVTLAKEAALRWTGKQVYFTKPAFFQSLRFSQIIEPLPPMTG